MPERENPYAVVREFPYTELKNHPVGRARRRHPDVSPANLPEDEQAVLVKAAKPRAEIGAGLTIGSGHVFFFRATELLR